MTNYKPNQNDSVVYAGAAVQDLGAAGHSQEGDYHASLFILQNGNAFQRVQPPTENTSCLSTTPAVPKMGVRARIADWPPKREPFNDTLKPVALQGTQQLGINRSFTSTKGFHNGQMLHNPNVCGSSGFRGLYRSLRRRSREAEFQDSWPKSPRLPSRYFTPLRSRSNSEITLSEYDTEEFFEFRGNKYVTGMPLYREYGSTSSIDVQGVSEQSFFDILKEFCTEKPDQRSAAPEKFTDLLRVDCNVDFNLRFAAKSNIDSQNDQSPKEELQTLQKEKERTRKKNPKVEAGDILLRKLRVSKSDTEPVKSCTDQEDSRPQNSNKPWVCLKSFAHYDVQSILFDLNEVVSSRAYVAQRRNTTTGASAASTSVSRMVTPEGPDSAFMSTEDLNCKENLETDLGDNNSNDLLLSCPHFRNETGGMSERNVCFSKASAVSNIRDESCFYESPPIMHCTNASISVLEVPKEMKQINWEKLKHCSIEHVDLGARFYQEYFYGKEHSSYFGIDEKLGPVAVSIRREKLDDHKDYGPQYQYRIIFRTSELRTLRGSILEDAIPSTAKHGTVRGLPVKEILEYIIPELNSSCLRLSVSTSKVADQLLKLDEQGLSKKHKVGVLYCKAGQSTEEEMYNNEEASAPFEEFMLLLGEKVCLKGFTKYAAQLDTKTDSTGTHSLYTEHQDYEVMFHVSTMLPYTPNNRQQLLRKRHIGNDIVTVIFQEPGALPFTPQNIRSHFQHVFVIVRVHNPCTENVCYSVSVTRSKDVPPFGPAIPSGVKFHKSDVFRDFLLAKLINAENAAHKSEKFHLMAIRTRQEYLKDLAENFITSTPIDSGGKFTLISLTSKKKEKNKPRLGAELYSCGTITWRVLAQDFAQGGEIDCMFGVSEEFIILIEQSSKEVVFNCLCGDVIGWTPDTSTLKIFFGRGDHIFARTVDSNPDDVKEVIQRLKVTTKGCETVDMTLRRNGLGQLGFHVKYDGTVAEVEEYGFAWQAGLRQGSRLVEICKVAVATLNHDQMIDLLRTSVTVKVVIVPPFEDGTPRRGCTETYEMNTVEHKPELESLPAGYRPPYRSSPAWQWSGPASHNMSQPQRWSSLGQVQSLTRSQKPSVSYHETHSLQTKRPVSFPEAPYSASSSLGLTERIQTHRNPSGSFSTPGSANSANSNIPPYNRSTTTPERFTTPQRPLVHYEQQYRHEAVISGDPSSGGLGSQEGIMEHQKPEQLWHIPASARVTSFAGSNVNKRHNRQEVVGKESPNRHPKGETQYSSHSSSNTLSSNASSSHSDDRWFDMPSRMETEQDPVTRGGVNGSNTDAAIYNPSPNVNSKPLRPSHPNDKMQKVINVSTTFSGTPDQSGRTADWPGYITDKRKESLASLNNSSQNKLFRSKMYTTNINSSPRGLPSSSSSDMLKDSSIVNSGQSSASQLFKPSGAENPWPCKIPHSSSFQLSASVPKSFSCSQPMKNKSPAEWKISEETPTRPPTMTDVKKQIDMTSKNIFGEPRLRASLRDLRYPRKNYKSSIEDDLKKLIILDNPRTEQESESTNPPRTALQRTLSDESICSGRRDTSYASTVGFEQTLPNDNVFTSAYPCKTLPVHRHYQQQASPNLPDKKSNISSSEHSLTDAHDKVQGSRIDPGMMPLPDTASGLEWSSLVSAAKAYEVQRAVSLFSLGDPLPSPDARPLINPVCTSMPFEKVTSPQTTSGISEGSTTALTGKVHQLEAMLKQLHNDLEKEKQDKVALQFEVASLRQNNQLLQEESQCATEQLRKFAQLFSNTVEKK
ncbi:signal-induced proliferation-associated 1-like protein 3 [Protopterus annectens]|uniref:signal-induced proliferation-associated 1-like protein 3 n=1 Tax=Protopterus annectens TaxID=7888 RepID=UPI001CFB2AFD|nr:signal-induced proliferation-associated 1-like protein 3 [Protopterus annectens]XP_043918215.1 signal-induced proliferation-associated 1-like protein 3 [Protopterus annectens]XP_043918223.1 signal-induced proliferation-associated 1-like protein 3 [Protopterus annectens]